jgi:hypothetical protein
MLCSVIDVLRGEVTRLAARRLAVRDLLNSHGRDDRPLFRSLVVWSHNRCQVSALAARLSPKTVRLACGFPQLDGTVLAAGSVEFAVWRECARPYGTVVTLACFCRFVRKLLLRQGEQITYQSQHQSRDPIHAQRYPWHYRSRNDAGFHTQTH